MRKIHGKRSQFLSAALERAGFISSIWKDYVSLFHPFWDKSFKFLWRKNYLLQEHIFLGFYQLSHIGDCDLRNHGILMVTKIIIRDKV
jgi:hypothetical protein